MGATGFEHPAENSGKTRVLAHSGAESGALSVRDGVGLSSDDPDLRAVVEAWPNLPDTVKAGILAMIRTCQG